MFKKASPKERKGGSYTQKRGGGKGGGVGIEKVRVKGLWNRLKCEKRKGNKNGEGQNRGGEVDNA